MNLATIMPPPEVYHTLSYKIPDGFPETLIYKGAVFDFEELLELLNNNKSIIQDS